MMNPTPNILILMADQLTPFALPAYGNRVARTPTLDRLAAQGVVFDAAYCAAVRAVAFLAADGQAAVGDRRLR